MSRSKRLKPSWNTLQIALRAAGKKCCTDCGKTKNLSEFRKRPHRKNERVGFCISCGSKRLLRLKVKYDRRSYNPWSLGRNVLKMISNAAAEARTTKKPVVVILHPPERV